jgi:stalled ribosome alternative rescue factor ArfA
MKKKRGKKGEIGEYERQANKRWRKWNNNKKFSQVISKIKLHT